jgi:uncharacterized repeat protein (TIGR01451 family)
MWIGAAQAVHDNGMFELDGNTIHNSATTPPYDWNSLFDASGNRLVTPDPVNGPILADVFVSDAARPDASYFASNKDIEAIADWGCVTQNTPTPKDDLLNAYAALVQVPANAPDNAGDQVLYLASERLSHNGDSFAGFWLLKDSSVGCSGSGSFSGQHTDGDLLILSNYTNGGGTQDVQVYRWTGDDATGAPVPVASLSGSTCSASLSGDDACAIANSAGIITPWSPTLHASNTFVEAGIDLTTLLGAEGGCFTTFMAETRSSQEITATLKDFASGQFSTCVPPTVDTTIKNAADDSTVSGALPIGSSVYDTATLSDLITGKDPTGTLNFTFFTNGDCSGDGTPAGTGVALDGQSDTEGPLGPGEYSFQAKYIAGDDPNYTDSAPSACEPLTISQGSLTPSTTIKNAADDSVVDGTLPLGSSVYDTTSLSGNVEGFDPTGTIEYRFFSAIDCSGESVSAGDSVALDGQSDTEGPLGAGGYSFDSRYVAGEGDNYPTSDWSACEPLTIGTNVPSASTTLKNAATNATVANGSTLGHGSSVYDTAAISSGDSFPLTGSVSFRFFHNGACTGTPASVQSGVAVGGHSAATGALDVGSYGFQAMYVAGADPNHTDSDWSACEPFNVAALVDLSITKAGSPASQTLGDGNITWTIVVTNDGPDADGDVVIADPMPAGNTFVSAASTKGSCTGGAILHCTIGAMAVGEKVTITLVTTPSTVGPQTNTVTVSGSRPESNTANNTASATVQTVGVITPPVFCVAVSKVTPKQLFVGRKTKLTIHVTQNKKAVKGVHVLIKGPKINLRTGASNSKGVVTAKIKMKKAGILIFSPIASKRCNTKRVGVTNVFTPPVTG